MLSKGYKILLIMLLIANTAVVSAGQLTLNGWNTENYTETFAQKYGFPIMEDGDGQYVNVPSRMKVQFAEHTVNNYSMEIKFKIADSTKPPSYYFNIYAGENVAQSESIRYEVSTAYGTMPNFYQGANRIKGALNGNAKPVDNAMQTIKIECSSTDGLQYTTRFMLNGQTSTFSAKFSKVPDVVGGFEFSNSNATTSLHIYEININTAKGYNISCDDVNDGQLLPNNKAINVVCNTDYYVSNGDVFVSTLFKDNKMIDIDIVPIVFEEGEEQKDFICVLNTPEKTEGCEIYTHIWNGIKNSTAKTGYGKFGR